MSEIVVKGVRPPSGDKEVGPAVIVEVGDRDPMPIAPGECGQAGRNGCVLEGSVAAIAEEAVSERRARRGGNRSALNGVNVEPAVAVKIEDADTAARGLRELMLRAESVVERENEPSALRVIDERGHAPLGDRLACASCRRPVQPQQVG